MSRWYDKRPILGKRLEAFKEMNPQLRESIIEEVMYLIEQYDADLISDKQAFTFDCNQQRWYDNDPFLWLMFNTLKLADDTLLQIVEVY